MRGWLAALAGALSFGLAVVAAAPASAQDEAAETARLGRECKGGRGDIAACDGYAHRLYNGIGAAKDHPTALKISRATCERKSGLGCNNAGVLLRWSDVVAQDLPAAFGYFERACGLSHGAACLQVGYMRRDGIGATVDAEMARRGFSLACANRNGDGCVQQGRIYADGLGNVGKHEGNAINSFRAGCALNHAEACALVGYMAYTGRGMPVDLDLAVRQYQRGCEGGTEFACSNLEAIRKGGPSTPGYAQLAAREAASRAFPADLPAEQRFLLASAALRDGNLALALTGFEMLAEQGMADAAYNLGQIYWEGKGVAMDRPRAVRYFDRAASAGHPHAMFVVAHFYRSGFVLNHNPIWAIQMMRGAAEKGIADADPIWRAWQNEREAYFDERDRQIREMARESEESQRRAEAANMARIWGLYSSRQNQAGEGQVCGTIYRNNQANYECMARETFDRYYNPARR